MRYNEGDGTLKIGIIGAGRRGATRAGALARYPGMHLIGVSDADAEKAQTLAERHGTRSYASTAALLTDADAVCITTPLADRFLIARTAVGEGTHVFAEWPPAPGPTEAERLSRLAEEAGVEVGVAHPFSLSPFLHAASPDWRPRLLTLALDIAPDDETLAALPWTHRLAGVLALCVGLAQGAEVQRLEAEADRDGARLRAVALGLRFRGGLYAQATVRERARAVVPHERFRLDASGSGLVLNARALEGPVCVEYDDASETAPNPHPALAFGATAPPSASTDEAADFVAAVVAGRPAPVSIFDALHTLRLTERLMDRLR